MPGWVRLTYVGGGFYRVQVGESMPEAHHHVALTQVALHCHPPCIPPLLICNSILVLLVHKQIFWMALDTLDLISVTASMQQQKFVWLRDGAGRSIVVRTCAVS